MGFEFLWISLLEWALLDSLHQINTGIKNFANSHILEFKKNFTIMKYVIITGVGGGFNNESH